MFEHRGSKDDGGSEEGPIGATVQKGGATLFRVWAPDRRRVEVVVESREDKTSIPLAAEGAGYFATIAQGVGAGARYGFRLDGGALVLADPASRSQPEGPEGLSEVIDPGAFAWTDGTWRGCRLDGQVLYELHVGTFTREGTWEAARRRLPALAELGITVIEMMPVADFAGAFGWGYDGVNLFAPTRLYGTPDDLRRFVDAAHRLGLGVILDVVYNHLGPKGNVLDRFSSHYASATHKTDWGPCLNYDGPECAPVRRFVAANAAYWIREFHFDGLRIDAAQNVEDDSAEHVLVSITAAARAAAGDREVLVIAEDEPQEAKLVRTRERGGYGLDAVWNDDFHHAARVALTRCREAYYQDYSGGPQELVSAIKYGYLFQGQYYRWQKKRRGTPARDLAPSQFVTFLENHDQVANAGRGDRLWQLTSPAKWRALVGLVLLGPGTPLLFQGEEFQSSAPFTFFADHQGELGRMVTEGRRAFLTQFPSLATPAAQETIPDPRLRRTFEACKLDWDEKARNAATWTMYVELIALRKSDSAFSRARPGGVDGAVLGPRAFALRWFGAQEDRLLLVNLDADALALDSTAEPLLAPPSRAGWALLWSSQDPRYGGAGTPRVETDGAFVLPGESTVVMSPKAKGVP
ncbi:MAG TPA: malto-oligosyltrehalose trehalohydrolase [Polyangiaceae bacterium]